MIVAVLAILLAIRGHVAGSLQTILWDSTAFPEDGLAVDVNLNDAITIKCPRVDESEAHKAQYSEIYYVPKQGYDECRTDISDTRLLLQCNEPYEETSYVLLIQGYSPIPNDLLFQRGHEYYFISVGGGSCVHNHTKLKVKVCCGTPSPPSTISFTTPTTKETNKIPELKTTTTDHKPTDKQEEEKTENSKETGNKDQQSSYSPTSSSPVFASCGLLLLLVSQILIGCLV